MNFLYANQQEILNQNIIEIKKKINISFEFFPPHNTSTKEMLWKSIKKLSQLKPTFVSVTHSSNPKKHKHTEKTVKDIKKETGLTTAPHLTCINSNPEKLKQTAKKYWNNGIHNIIALRGDQTNETNSSSMCAADLVHLLKKIGNFDISVAAYPEIHPKAKNAQSDLINLKKKIDAGANRAITQFFFEITSYLKFRDTCATKGINVDIIPGILPIFNFQKIQHFAKISKVKIPKWIPKFFQGLEDDLETQKMIGASIITDMIKILIKEGVTNFHFYTLNRYELTFMICHILGL